MNDRLKRSRAKLDALDEAAKMRHDLRLRWLDEAERAANHENEHPHVDATSPWIQQVEGVWDPDYKTRRPYINKEPPPPSVECRNGFLTAEARARMVEDIVRPSLSTDNQPERTVMDNDEIKVGDTVVDVRYSDGPPRTVIGVHEGLLWLKPPFGHTVVGYADDWRKVKTPTPTPCPESWCAVYPRYIGGSRSTRLACEAELEAPTWAEPIGLIHLSPNGDCEFIRTEEL